MLGSTDFALRAETAADAGAIRRVQREACARADARDIRCALPMSAGAFQIALLAQADRGPGIAQHHPAFARV